MAAGTSPMSALLTQKIMERLAQRGGPGQGAAGVSSPDVAGDQMTQQFQGLQGADPEMAMKTLKKINQMLSGIYIQMITQVPDAAQKIADAQKAISKAIEPIQKAAATLNAVRPQIANSANLPPGMMQQAGGAGGGDAGGDMGGGGM